MNTLTNTFPVLTKTSRPVKPPCAQDLQLWESFRSGSRDALNEIFERYARLLYAYGRNMTLDYGLISDCIQDLFVELWIKREIVAPKVNSIKYYLVKSVRRRIARRLSADCRIIGQSIPDEYSSNVAFNAEFDLVQEQMSHEVALHVKASVSSLSKGQQEAIYLKFYENMTYEQIASVMNTNVKAVYNLIGKSIITLRKTFKVHPLTRE